MSGLTTVVRSAAPRSTAGAHHQPARTRQRGAATLIVVMVLFFVMSLVAAYSSRNVVFEQKTSSNLQTANVLQETAEAGVEWAVAMLNSGNITDTCAPNLNPAAPTPSFRQRYLTFDPERAFDPNGRGIAMAKMLSFSELEYRGKGNQVVATVRATV